MSDCLFCRIAAGDIPARRIYADEQALAFLDIAPWHRGHTLVVPRRHVPDLINGEPVLTEIAPAVDTVARLLVDRLGADGINLFCSSGAVAGQEVFHLHLHLVPRYAETPGGARMVNRDYRPSDDDLDELMSLLTASPTP
jgi:histidine triad (HIT) family protein